METFAERLTLAMQRAGLSAAQLAKQTGIGRSSISQWLSEKYVAKYDKVVTLAAALDVAPEWLIGAAPETAVAATSTAAKPDEAPTVATPNVAAATSATPEPTSDPLATELRDIWAVLTPDERKKLIKKAVKLRSKDVAPTSKKKSKKNKRKKNGKGKKKRS